MTRDTYLAVAEIAEDAGLDTIDVTAVVSAFRDGLPYGSKQDLLDALAGALPDRRKSVAGRIADYVIESYGS